LSSVMQDQAFKSSLCINPSLCWTIRFPNLQLKRVMLQIPHKSMVIQFETPPKKKKTPLGHLHKIHNITKKMILQTFSCHWHWEYTEQTT
jgi:hypothetical protein